MIDNKMKDYLTEKWGLDTTDIIALERILTKIDPPIEEIKSFDKECQDSIPFEAGMGFTEALIGLKQAFDENL